MPTLPPGFSRGMTLRSRVTGSSIWLYTSTISSASMGPGSIGLLGVPMIACTLVSPARLTRRLMDSIIWGWMSSA